MSTEILENLKKTIIEYDNKGAENLAKKAVEKGIDPVQAMEAVTDAIRQVGEGFGSGELFLPDLLMAAKATQSAMSIIEKEIKKTGKERKTSGRVVIGTVAGDIHDIGKNLVATLLLAAGFEVIDLGVDVPPQKFIEFVKEHKPDVLAMSALLSTTSLQQMVVIRTLESEGLRGDVKIIVGGGAISEEFAKNIKADGYAAVASETPELVKSLLGKK